MISPAFQPQARAADARRFASRFCGTPAPALRRCNAQECRCETWTAACSTWAARQQRRRAAAAAVPDGGAPQPLQFNLFPADLDDWYVDDLDNEPQWEVELTEALEEEGWQVAGDPLLQGCVARAAGLVHFLLHCEPDSLSVHLSLAPQLALAVCRLDAAAAFGGGGGGSGGGGSSDGGSSPGAGSSSIAGLTQAKFELFRRLTSAEDRWAPALARVLVDGEEAALLAPLADAEAALRFASAQLQRASRRRHAQLRAPSLPALFWAHPDIGGALLAQHPAAWQQHAAPWLRQRLGWGDGALADAALSPQYAALCTLDPAAAQARLDWLLATGLSPAQAAAALAPPGLRALVEAPAQHAALAARVDELAAAWGVGRGLAAALVLAQPPMAAVAAELTGQLVGVLQGTAGLSEQQLLRFVLGGGLDGGCTRSEAALAQATRRLKQLLLVYGSWEAAAEVLAADPDLLSMSWQGLESVLQTPAQRAAWAAAGALEAAAAEEEASGVTWLLLS